MTKGRVTAQSQLEVLDVVRQLHSDLDLENKPLTLQDLRTVRESFGGG